MKTLNVVLGNWIDFKFQLKLRFSQMKFRKKWSKRKPEIKEMLIEEFKNGFKISNMSQDLKCKLYAFQLQLQLCFSYSC